MNTDNRTDKIVILLTEEEKQQIIDESRRDHMDTSAWCRGVLLRHRDKLVDEREARKSRMERIKNGDRR